MTARECYIAMLEMEDHQQTMCIGEQRTIAEPIEVLEEVILDESRPDKLPKNESGRIHVEPRRHVGNRFVNNSP